MAEPFVEKDPEEPGLFYIKFARVGNGIVQLSILSKFFIYSLTVASFRRFLVTKFNEIFRVYSKKPSPQGNVI